MIHHAVRPVAHPRHLGWASRAIVSGFLASTAALLVLLAAYGFADAVGSTNPAANALARPLWNLTHNPVTSLVASIHTVQAAGLHVAVGLGWAVIYAALVEPNVSGPGWRKGLLFAIVPCLISLFVFLPFIGAGLFGLAVGAGPMAGLGAILLHAVYGVTLGETYALADGEGVLGGVDSVQSKILTAIERDMAMGLVIGAVLGAVMSVTLSILGVAGLGGSNATVLNSVGGAIEGAFLGVVIGIFIGVITSDGDRLALIKAKDEE